MMMVSAFVNPPSNSGLRVANRSKAYICSRNGQGQKCLCSPRRESSRFNIVARTQGSRSRVRRSANVDESHVLGIAEELGEHCDGRLDKFESSCPELVADLLSAVSTLEESSMKQAGAGFRSGTVKKSMPGRWRLLFTNNEVIVRNKGGITGLPVPGAHCTSVDVVLDLNGHAETQERLKLGFLKPVNSLIGTWCLSGGSGRTLEVTYAEAVVFGGPRMRSDSKAVLETTHVGAELRVGRSMSGDVYLFRRVPA